MKKYRGYYIDGIIFKSEAEIDRFYTENAVRKFKQAIVYFKKHGNIEASAHADEIAERLHKVHGFTWEEIEQIEIDALTS